MSVTSGFFDSLNGDRRYNAEQMSSIFNGIITDGVFQSIGDGFMVKAAGENAVTVGIGRCWFNSTWVYNDALLPLTLENADVIQDRIDAVVVEIDRSMEIRSGNIKVVKGVANYSPDHPAMEDSEFVHQYPLAYILRPAGTNTVTQANITNAIGTSECPYITAILKTQNIDKIVAQWEGEFDQWFKELNVTMEGNVATNLAAQIGAMRYASSVTLYADEWVQEDLERYSYTVNFKGITPNTQLIDIGIAYPENCGKSEKKAIDKAAGYIYGVTTETDKIVFYAYNKASYDVTYSFLNGTGAESKYYSDSTDIATDTDLTEMLEEIGE